MGLTIDFKNKTVLITGATRGIGQTLANQFEDAGAELILTGTQTAEIKRLNQSASPKRRYLQVDFSNEKSLGRFLTELDATSKIDVCVNNAGINRIADVEELNTADFDDVTNVNLRAPLMIIQRLVPGMKHRRHGRIVNIASIWSEISKPGRGAYSAAKAGLAGLTRALAVELARHNVLVNCVSPGFTMTDLTKRSLSKKEIHELEAQIPIGRMAKPEELGGLVLFLASDLNTYLTGQNLIVDGGFVNV